MKKNSLKLPLLSLAVSLALAGTLPARGEPAQPELTPAAPTVKETIFKVAGYAGTEYPDDLAFTPAGCHVA